MAVRNSGLKVNSEVDGSNLRIARSNPDPLASVLVGTM
jgi:uncharacterized protein YajQ (UPF0234 family)